MLSSPEGKPALILSFRLDHAFRQSLCRLLFAVKDQMGGPQPAAVVIPRGGGRFRGGSHRLIWMVLSVWVWWSVAAPWGSAQDTREVHPQRAGILVIEAGLDSTAGFRWVSLPEQGVRCLTWRDGTLVLPLEQPTGQFGVDDLTLPFDSGMMGISDGRRLLFREGRYPIDRPLLLADGSRWIFFSRGELVIEPGRIIYRQGPPPTNLKAQYLLLAGIVILITVLMVRIRRRLRET
jgi:hypothetical protein